MNDITYFGRTNFRNQNKRFGIYENDRFCHTYIIGKTGVGKTTLLKVKIQQDIINGKGFAVFDPHGDLADSVISMIPEARMEDLIYFDATSPSCNLRYNPLKHVSIEQRPLVASGLLEALKKQFGADSWGVRMEHILRNCLLTLLDQPKTDISEVLKLLNDKDFRNRCIKNIANESVKEFWTDEYAKYPPFTRQAAIAPIQNKVGAFLSNPVTKRILVENTEDVSLRRAMESRKIIIVNLSKGKIGFDASNLLGGLLLTSLGLSAFSRQDQPEGERKPFFIYCDEFQNFTTSFTVSALSELRKYKVGLILANQYIKQIDNEVRDAVFGNIGTLIVFRVGVEDAQFLRKELNGRADKFDLASQANFEFNIRLIVNGQACQSFSGHLTVGY